MCSRVCSSAAVRRSAVEVRRLLHSRSSCSSSTSNIVGYGSARRNCSPSSSSLAKVAPWNQGLQRETMLPARGLVLERRTFTSLPQPSTAVTTTTKLSVDGGVMTISLPLPGLPGLTAVRVPVDVPVRDFVNELMTLDKRWAFVFWGGGCVRRALFSRLFCSHELERLSVCRRCSADTNTGTITQQGGMWHQRTYIHHVSGVAASVKPPACPLWFCLAHVLQV